jgi:hypothetical protein
VSREALAWGGVLAALAAFIAVLLVVSSFGEPRAELIATPVAEILTGDDQPADRFGDRELRIVGWFAALHADCRGEPGAADDEIAWLQRTCPLRVLLAEQPREGVTQAELEASGVRLAAASGEPFAPPAQPGGVQTLLQQLVVTGHFDDPAAGGCLPELRQRCRNTVVVTDTDGYVR